MKVLITSRPMLGMIDDLKTYFDEKDVEVFCPEIVQSMPEDELLGLVPEFDGWIIGDDPATRKVLTAGKNGALKAAVKWGVGTDNVDFLAAQDLSIPITNTPNMFGGEVADIVMSYMVTLARKTFLVDREVKAGKWPKPRGISLAGKKLGLVGFGDVGTAVARRALAAEMQLIVYTHDGEPNKNQESVDYARWPERIGECDFLVFACSLSSTNLHMLNYLVLNQVKRGVRIINVARGGLISEDALIDALQDGRVHSVALDVFEEEPLPSDSQLRDFEQCIFGSHNCSNTDDAVIRASEQAISSLFNMLGIK